MSARGGARVLVTGGAGFIGANLADRLLGEGCEVVVLDALARAGVERNLAWLQANHRELRFVQGDVRDRAAVNRAMEGADAVFHLAAQVAVTTSLDAPREDFETNLLGTLNVLEAARQRSAPVVFASTNKVYGDLADIALELSDDAWLPTDPELRAHGVPEARPLDFHTPYGCSKGGADQYVMDYSRSFGLHTCVLRMSCIYGPRQMGTEDQGWVAHFLISALKGESISIYGDGRQVRDVMHVADAVDAYVSAWDRIAEVSGRAFNLGGGGANAVSLRQVLERIAELTGRPPQVVYAGARPGDQRYFVADARAAQAALGLGSPRGWRAGMDDLHAWLHREHGLGQADAEQPAPRLRAAAL